MRSGMAARIAAADADPTAVQRGRVALRRLRGGSLIFLLIGLSAYLIGLIALLPAKLVLPESGNLKVGGTVWNGEAVLASTIKIDWQVAPLRTIAALSPSADFHLAGGGTDLAGSVSRGAGALRFGDVSGQIDGSLLTALAPNLPVQCRFIAQSKIQRLALGGAAQGAEGTLLASPANCLSIAAGAPPFDLPATRFEAVTDDRGSRGALMTVTGREHLLEVRLSPDGNISIWPTASLVRSAPILAGLRYDDHID